MSIDDEITFKMPEQQNKETTNEKRRGSSSSEDRADLVDTSDELMEVDCDKFIADCEMEARLNKQRERQNKGDSPGDFRSKSEQMICDAEAARARIYVSPGKQGMSSLVMDEEYMVIGAHIDSGLQQKIIDFEYIDFSHLILKDKINKLEDQRFELVVRGGSTFFAPVSDCEGTAVSNFSRWEQALRIYSNILTRAYPGKASKLIQYNHIIYTAALTFA